MAETIAEALRDLEAAKARVERDATLAADAMKKSLVEQLLPVLDNLDRTIAHADPSLVEGVAMVRAQLEGVLRGYGVERIDAKAELFDPAIHDAITTAPVATRAEDNVVVEQLAAGYRFNDTLLRPAKVVVGKFAAAKPASLPEHEELPRAPEPRIPAPEPRIPAPEPRIPAPEPRMPAPEPRGPAPESRGMAPESRIPAPAPRHAVPGLPAMPPRTAAPAPLRGITPLPIRPAPAPTPVPRESAVPEYDPYDFQTRPIRRAIPRPQYTRDPWGRLIRRY